MTPETKLKVAAEEIKEILRKHDIAGAVALHTPGHGEYFVHTATSYSCAYRYNENEIRFYSKRADYNSAAEQIKKQANTSNMLKVLTDMCAFCFGFLQPTSEKFDKLTNAEHY